MSFGRKVVLEDVHVSQKLVWTGSSSSSVAVGHNPKDPTPSHIRSDLDALHHSIKSHQYAKPRALWLQFTQMILRDPYIAARDATAPATDNDDSPIEGDFTI
ncbi:hypothetical protein Tco_0606693 [Tanacetum coccineum]